MSDAEADVIGGILSSAAALSEVATILRPEDFAGERERVIFEIALDLHSHGVGVDVLSVVDEARKRGALEFVGGPLGVREYASEASFGTVHNAKIVSDDAVRRRILSACSDLIALSEAGADVADLSAKAESLILESAAKQRSPSKRIGLIVSEVLDSLEHNRVLARQSGVAELDRVMGGLMPGALIILAAKTAVGKSALAKDIARHVADQAPVLFFSLEMGEWETGARLLSTESGVSWSRVRARQLAQADWTSLASAAETLQDPPLHVFDSSDATVSDIRSEARRVRARGDLGLIVVDYLQLMQPTGKSDTRAQEVANITRALKVLARDLEVPVLAASQLKRPQAGGNTSPRLSDLRESGSIEQDADVVIFLERDPEADDPVLRSETVVRIAKHRNGPPARFTLYFDEGTVSFRQYPYPPDPGNGA